MILRAVLVLLLVANLGLILLQFRSGPGAMDRIPFALIEVTGGSMEPKLHEGDAILAYQSPYSELEVGDVIVFSRDNGLIVHEIIEVREDCLITQGCANELPDSPVTETDYRAEMLFCIPKLGGIRKIYTSPLRFLTFAVLLGLLIFGTDIFSAVYEALFERKKK